MSIYPNYQEKTEVFDEKNVEKRRKFTNLSSRKVVEIDKNDSKCYS